MIKRYDRAVAMFPHPGEASGDSNLIWNAYDEYRRIHPIANEKEANKLMVEYEYYISADGKDWTKAANGTIRTFGREHYQSFTPTLGRCVKIRAVKPLKGSTIAGGEFYLYRGI